MAGTQIVPTCSEVEDFGTHCLRGNSVARTRLAEFTRRTPALRRQFPPASIALMWIDETRNRLRAEPFRAFTVHVPDGSQVNIHHHDYAWLLPSGGELHVEDSLGKVHLIATAQIFQLSYDAPQESPAQP